MAATGGGAGGPASAAATVTPATLDRIVREAVAAVKVTDVHTHLFPPSHGELLLWGVDALLTYHYLIAELFTVVDSEADGVTPESFHAMPITEQANVVWEHLFVRRSPLSEACRGVLTTLRAFGLEAAAAAKDLTAIRTWFSERTAEEHLAHVFKLSGVEFAVMTNQPFVPEEAVHWGVVANGGAARDAAAARPVPACLKAALRVDPVLKGDWDTVAAALRAAGWPATLSAARAYLRAWAERMQPVYFMASTPGDFEYAVPPAPAAGEEPTEEQLAESPPSLATLLHGVLVPVALELGLPLALKVGACRGVNPRLRSGGDGVTVADLSFLGDVCRRYPRLKVLATVLSRDNQHELAVLARKFGNLHIYGCWWFCNVPSIIHDTTTMRMELLGTAFTAQHSDARVLDQLIYKWAHSRSVVADVLAAQYRKLLETGWVLSEADVQRDAALLLGGSYAAFMNKSVP